MNALDSLLRELGHGRLAFEAAVLVGCLGGAAAISWLLGRKAAPDSIWFGRVVVDGLMFPTLALALVYGARFALDVQKAPLLRMTLPVLVSLVGIRFLARVFTVVFPKSGLARAVERVFSWLAWAAAVLWILGLLPVVLEEMDSIQFVFGKSKLTLLGILQGVLSSGLVLVVALWISALIERRLLRENIHDLSLRKAAANVVRAALLTVGILFALSAVGVDLTALSVLGGALGVGLGFGLQKLAANYVSGFVILTERSLRIGDTVRVENFEGIVADIKTRYTLIRAGDGRASIVPNEKLITERIENLSLADPRMLLTIDISVGYESDPDQVIKLLEDAAVRTQRVLADPAPAARLVAFGADGLDFRVLFWIDDPVNGQSNVKSDISLRILKALREAKIDIPYPQRVVHLPKPVEVVSPAEDGTG